MSVWEQLKSIFVREPREIEFRPEWEGYLSRNVPLYRKLPPELQERLRERTMHLVATTYFEGCSGLELDDEIILTIAAQATLLVLNLPGDPYHSLNTILVYPSAFSSVTRRREAGGVVHEGVVTRLGESSTNGTVTLAWDSVRRGARNIYDGHNVTFHEFAHQLDQAWGEGDGVPELSEKSAYSTWVTVLAEEYDDLLKAIENRRKTLLNPYGATNPAEFFAVATETFFEKPRQMKRKMPELYGELQAYYRSDPAEWFDRS